MKFEYLKKILLQTAQTSYFEPHEPDPTEPNSNIPGPLLQVCMSFNRFYVLYFPVSSMKVSNFPITNIAIIIALCIAVIYTAIGFPGEILWLKHHQKLWSPNIGNRKSYNRDSGIELQKLNQKVSLKFVEQYDCTGNSEKHIDRDTERQIQQKKHQPIFQKSVDLSSTQTYFHGGLRILNVLRGWLISFSTQFLAYQSPPIHSTSPLSWN